MPKKAKSKQSALQRTPKFVYGASVGIVLGGLAILTNPGLAVYLLVGLVAIAAYVFFLTYQHSTTKKWSQRQPLSAKPAIGALVIAVMSIAGVQYLGISSAWHPQGTIKKSVQNVTTSSPIIDGNTDSLTVKEGDILNYTIVIKNVAPNASNQYNDMAYTVMTDTLPAGIQLVSDPNKRTITENIGTILPGQSVTKTYQVKVVTNANGSILENKACFTANSVVKDNPQQGCDIAKVKTLVPPTPPPTPTPPTPPTPTPTPPTPTPTPPTPTPPTPTPPTPTPTPTPTPPNATPPTPTPITPTSTPSSELPNVGARSIIIIVLFAAVTGYLFSAVYGYMNSSKPIRFK